MPLKPYQLASPGALTASGGHYTFGPNINLIDSFEDANYSEWTLAYGPSGEYSIVSTGAYDGTYAFHADSSGSGYTALSGDLPNLPVAQGDTYRYWLKCSVGHNSGVKSKHYMGYGVQDSGGTQEYYMRPDFDAGTIRLYKYDSGDTQLAEDPTCNMNADTYYLHELVWGTDDSHTYTVYDAPPESGGTTIGSCSATEGTWTTGGISYEADLASGVTSTADYFHTL